MSKPDLATIRARATEQLEDTLWRICSDMDEESVPQDAADPAFVVAFQVIIEVYGGEIAERAKKFYLTDYE